MMRFRDHLCLALAAMALLTAAPAHSAATVQGYVFDPNWYAPHPLATGYYGMGLYEYGVSGSPNGSNVTGLYTNTENLADNFYQGIYGYFRKPGVNDGTYTMATWDVWWRSTYLFDVPVAGTPSPLFLRLHANMWSYAPTWTTGYNEYGQTFVATGSSVVMVVMRNASASVSNVTLSFHEGGPGGVQVGQPKTITLNGNLGDTRVTWNGGEVPTVPGNTYYLRIKSPSGQYPVLCNNEPAPDLSDPMPGGAAYHEGALWAPDRDLGITICSDDDGILTNMYTRSGGHILNSVTSAGQTFLARGTSLISFCAWIPDASADYIATVYDGVNGNQIGTAKRSRLMRWGDPEVMWLWNPGEVPLQPYSPYYVEITRAGGGAIPAVYANGYNPYPNGAAYSNRSLQQTVDLAGTTMEEESPGSAKMGQVQITGGPVVAPADRGPRTLTIRWVTDVPSDSKVEYAAWNGPYTAATTDSSLATNHAVTIGGLEPNAMYHIRVTSAATGKRPAVSRDFVACTVNGLQPNLLANPDFEEGSGASPRKPVPGWSYTGMDIGASDGTWFWGLPPYSGNWFLQGAVNGGSADARVWQRVTGTTPGAKYNFTCALTSWMRENNAWKYDVWHQGGRLDQMRIGIDTTGGTNPDSGSIKWTPYFYSHLRYTTAGISAVATGSAMSVFVQLKGQGGQWHLYGLDNCILSEAEPADSTPPTTPVVTDDGAFTTSTTELHASWSAEDPDSGIASYSYAIGTAPDLEDVVPWTSVGSSTSVTKTGLTLTGGQTYYFRVRATNGSGVVSAVGVSDGIQVAKPVLTIAEAKSYPDGYAVVLSSKTVSARISPAFWIEENDRSSGIRVESAMALSAGLKVNVSGMMDTLNGERRIKDVTVTPVSGGTAPKPLVIGNTALGGADLNEHTPGVAGGVGPNNVGLLVTVYGKVSSVGDSYFYIDDGGGVDDGSAAGAGVRVETAPAGIAVGDVVAVTGISSVTSSGGANQRRVIPRASGVKVLAP